MTGIYKVQRKHGVKWYAKVNYTIAGIHYQKKSSVFDSQKEARMAEIELQEWVRQVIQEAEMGQTDAFADMPQEVTQRRTEPPTALPEHAYTASSTSVTGAQKRPQRLVAPTYGQVWEEYRNTPKIKELKRSSLKAKDDAQAFILPHFRDVKIKDIDAEMLQMWQQYMKSYITRNGTPMADSSLRRTQMQLNAVLNYAVEKGYLRYSPMVDLTDLGSSVTPERPTWSDEEFYLFRQVAPEEWRVFYDLMYLMGLRIGEARAITPADITYENGCAYLHITKSCDIDGETDSPKSTSSTRTLLLPPEIEQGLVDRISRTYGLKPYERIFWERPGGIYAITNRACETAGVCKISHHDMRHSCATNLVASGEYTLVDAARFLGHKNAFVTANTYAHSPQTHKAAIADSVSKRMQRMAA